MSRSSSIDAGAAIGCLLTGIVIGLLLGIFAVPLLRSCIHHAAHLQTSPTQICHDRSRFSTANAGTLTWTTAADDMEKAAARFSLSRPKFLKVIGRSETSEPSIVVIGSYQEPQVSPFDRVQFDRSMKRAPYEPRPESLVTVLSEAKGILIGEAEGDPLRMQMAVEHELSRACSSKKINALTPPSRGGTSLSTKKESPSPSPRSSIKWKSPLLSLKISSRISLAATSVVSSPSEYSVASAKTHAQQLSNISSSPSALPSIGAPQPALNPSASHHTTASSIPLVQSWAVSTARQPFNSNGGQISTIGTKGSIQYRSSESFLQASSSPSLSSRPRGPRPVTAQPYSTRFSVGQGWKRNSLLHGLQSPMEPLMDDEVMQTTFKDPLRFSVATKPAVNECSCDCKLQLEELVMR